SRHHRRLLGSRRRHNLHGHAPRARRVELHIGGRTGSGHAECSGMTRSSTVQAPTEARHDQVAGAKPRILIVDDEPSMRDMLRIVMRRDGFDVEVAANGKEAIELLKRERIDLLLSDIRMPDVSGVDVLRAAKEVNRDIVAFMMTAFASTDTAVEAMRL